MSRAQKILKTNEALFDSGNSIPGLGGRVRRLAKSVGMGYVADAMVAAGISDDEERPNVINDVMQRSNTTANGAITAFIRIIASGKKTLKIPQ